MKNNTGGNHDVEEIKDCEVESLKNIIAGFCSHIECYKCKFEPKKWCSLKDKNNNIPKYEEWINQTEK